MKEGFLEILLNGEKKILMAKKLNGLWQYQRGKIKVIKECGPVELRRMLINYYEGQGIDTKINICNITNYTQNEKMVPEEIRGSV